MTLIVGVIDHDSGAVLIGGDSFVGNGEYVVKSPSDKVFSRYTNAGKIIFGVSGDFRGDNLLRQVRPPEHSDGLATDQYISGPLVDAIQAKFKAHRYTQSDQEKDSQDLTIMIGYQGRLFTMWVNFDVIEAINYMAIGAGMYVALGSLFSTVRDYPADKITRAIEAAAYHNPFVRTPYTIVSTLEEETDNDDD